MSRIEDKKPTAHNRWRDNNDFEQDLFAISDFAQKSAFEPSVYARRARTKATLGLSEDEQATEIPRGRGRSLLWNNQPGGTPSFLQSQKETSKEIRQTNRFGYCNDQIEEMLSINKSEVAVKPMQNVRLNSSPSSSTNTSRSSTPSQSSTGTYDNCTNSKQEVVATLSLCDIVRMNAKPNNISKNVHDGFININSLKDFPEL